MIADNTELPESEKQILAALAKGPGQGMRFSEIRKAMKISNNDKLSSDLKSLQLRGLISRMVLDTTPPHTVYQSVPGVKQSGAILPKTISSAAAAAKPMQNRELSALKDSESEIRAYVSRRNGSFTVSECARELNLPMGEVIRVLSMITNQTDVL